jgi:PE-PPE domain
VRQGVDRLGEKNPGPGDVVFAFSQGAVAASTFKAENPGTGATYVLVENPSRPNGGVMQRFNGLTIPILDISFSGATPETGDPTIDIARQYSGCPEPGVTELDAPRRTSPRLALRERLSATPTGIRTHDGDRGGTDTASTRARSAHASSAHASSARAKPERPGTALRATLRSLTPKATKAKAPKATATASTGQD